MSAYIGYIKIGLFIIIGIVVMVKVWVVTTDIIKKFKGKTSNSEKDFETYEETMKL